MVIRTSRRRLSGEVASTGQEWEPHIFLEHRDEQRRPVAYTNSGHVLQLEVLVTAGKPDADGREQRGRDAATRTRLDCRALLAEPFSSSLHA